MQREEEEEKGREGSLLLERGRPGVIMLRTRGHQALKENFHKRNEY